MRSCTPQYLEANGHDSSTDLLSHHELFSQHGQDQILPAAGRQTFTQPNDPFTSTLISIILETFLWNGTISALEISLKVFLTLLFCCVCKWHKCKRLQLSHHTHLPHGLDSFLKQVEIAVAGQVARSDHVTIKTPELLHLQKQDSYELSIKWSTPLKT